MKQTWISLLFSFPGYTLLVAEIPKMRFQEKWRESIQRWEGDAHRTAMKVAEMKSTTAAYFPMGSS